LLKKKMATVKKLAIITFSTRTPRVGPRIAALINEIIANDADAKNGVEISSVAVADFNLPVYDEPVIPAMVPSTATFTQAHSIAWSNEMAKYAGYVLVVPEYNYGVAGSTKNAIDYLYNEWTGKPAAIISYGIKGGALANDALDTTLKGMKLGVVATRPLLTFHGGIGPDLNLAMTKGELGEDTRKDILAQSSSILKAFYELKALAGSPKA
jgi:NAD(P)H-dependent FMN reductase